MIGSHVFLFAPFSRDDDMAVSRLSDVIYVSFSSKRGIITKIPVIGLNFTFQNNNKS
jgi:hypothetical protein